MNSEIKIVNEHLKFPKVTLKKPLKKGFILISAEVDKRTSFWGESKLKKALIKKIKALSLKLKEEDHVLDITLFKASLFPPGRNGGYLKKARKKNQIHDRYDVTLLIELESLSHIEKIVDSTIYTSILKVFDELSFFYFVYIAENIKRIANVDHKKKGVFLFNFFVAKDKNQNLRIWEYTAGWFQDQTSLDNSTLFSSIDTKRNLYSVINHCRWDSFMNVLPSLIFKNTFKKYVLDNFEANNVAAIPILYRLA
jgi:hypothetical protein